MAQVRQVLRELYIGLAIWVLAVGIVLTVIASHRLAAAAGTLLGGLAAAGIIYHMYRHLDIALDLDEKHAKRHLQASYAKRFALMAAVLAVSFIFSRYLHPVGTVLGLFGVKISALCNPLIHKLFTRRSALLSKHEVV